MLPTHAKQKHGQQNVGKWGWEWSELGLWNPTLFYGMSRNTHNSHDCLINYNLWTPKIK